MSSNTELYVVKQVRQKQYVKIDHKGKLKLVRNITLATPFDYTKAKNIFNNCIPVKNQKQYKIKKYNDELFIQEKNDSKISNVTKSVSNSNITNEQNNTKIESEAATDDKSNNTKSDTKTEWNHYAALQEIVDNEETPVFEFSSLNEYIESNYNVKSFEKILENIPNIRKWLERNLQDTENKLLDIRHRIEFPKENGKEFNVFELYNFTKMQRDLLRDRRIIKNDIKRIDIILDEISGVDAIVNRLNGLNNQKYKPRVLTSLFEAV